MSLLRRRQLLGGLALGASACVPGPGANAPANPSRPRDADQIALDVVARRYPPGGPRTWALFHVDVARGTSIAWASRTVFGVGYLLDSMGIDLASDVRAVFCTSTGMVNYEHSCAAVHVIEHRLPPADIREAFGRAARLNGTQPMVSREGVECVEVSHGEVPRLLALPTPNLVVTLPYKAFDALSAFVASGGLPFPQQGEAVRGQVIRPEYDVVGVEVPSTLLGATAVVWLPSGDTRLDFTAISSDEHQAAVDADWLTTRVDEALTIDLAIAQLKVLGPYVFVADGRQVRTRVMLSAGETQWLVAMGCKVQPGGD